MPTYYVLELTLQNGLLCVEGGNRDGPAVVTLNGVWALVPDGQGGYTSSLASQRPYWTLTGGPHWSLDGYYLGHDGNNTPFNGSVNYLLVSQPAVTPGGDYVVNDYVPDPFEFGGSVPLLLSAYEVSPQPPASPRRRFGAAGRAGAVFSVFGRPATPNQAAGRAGAVFSVAGRPATPNQAAGRAGAVFAVAGAAG